MNKTSKIKLKKWLGESGIFFFKRIKEKYGRIDAIWAVDKIPDVSWVADKIPHAVHFNEGMTVRNFLRTLPEYKNYDACKLDDSWVSIIEEVIKDENCN